MAGLIFKTSSFITGLTSLILIVILLRYGTKKTHFLWAMFNVTVSVWGFGCFLVGFAQDTTTASNFWKVALVGGAITPIVFYHFIVVFGELNRKILLKLFYSYSFIFWLMVLFNIAGIKPVYIFNSVYYIRATDLRWVVIITIWLGIVFYSLVELYRILRTSFGNKRTQAFYLLIGFAVGFTGAFFDTFPFFGFNTFTFHFGNTLIGVYCMFVTYAILRHQLLDIEVIIKRTLVFAGLLASVFAMLLLPTFVIQEYILRKASFGGRALGLTISGIIIILALRRIENFLINSTDKILFQKKYDYKELLKTFTSEVLTVLDLNRLVTVTVNKLSDIIKLQSCSILLLDEDKKEYRLVASQGIKTRNISLKMDNTLTTFLSRTKHYLSVKTLEKEHRIPTRIIEDMNNLKLELAIPLMTLQGEMIGILTLGKKKSDEDYTQDDMDILLPLARTLAIAISNAQMVEDISKLQHEAIRRERIAMVGTLAAGMAHEIKNPLTAIKTFVEYVEKKYPDAEFREKFNSIVPREIDKIKHIADQLLDYSRIDKIILKNADVHEMLDYAVDLYNNEFIQKHIKINKIYCSGHPLVKCDENQLKQAFINIILNSIEAMPRGGNLTVETKDGGNTIEIAVKDTGTGIPKEMLKNAFDPFYTTKDKGTGLGLFIVHQILENSRGKVAIESEPGRGTVVRLAFEKAS